MARALAVSVALCAALLAVSGAGEAATEQTPKRGGTLVIATPEHGEPGCLNPLVDSCSVSSFLAGVLEGAFSVTPAATFRPDLASAEIVSKRPFVLVYHIRPEARWSDGVSVSARDFVFTWQVVGRLLPDADESTHIRSVRPVDTKTLRVVLRDPWPDWRSLFGVVLPRHALVGERVADIWQDSVVNPKTGAPIGSGPFILERFDRGRQIVLRRNPRYWGPHLAYLNRIVYRFTAPEKAADALRQRRVDMLNPGPAIFQAAALELRRQRTPGVRVLPVLDSAWEHLDIRMQTGGNPSLRNPLVRRALAYGIDREEIARVVGQLTGTPAAEPLDSVVFMANSRYYEPNWRGYRYRPQRARQLLGHAGCRRGADGIYVCPEGRLSLRLGTAGGVERRQRTAELAAAQLRRIGVDVKPVYYPPKVWVAPGGPLDTGDFDLFQFSWIEGASTAGPYDVYGCQRPDNFTGYCDRLVTRDLRQATRILDDRKRIELLNEIDARLAKAVPAIPLFQDTSLFAFSSDVHGVVPNAWNVGDWWLER